MNVVLVDDQSEFRTGLHDLLSSAAQIAVVGEAIDGGNAVDVVLRLRPDITLMDIRMPVMDGIAATAAIRAQWPDACILMLTTFDEDALVRDAMHAGATGYLLKGMPLDDMLAIFALALRGYTTIAPRARDAKLLGSDDIGASLSEREAQIWRLLAEGYTNRDIAGQLFITEGTVKNYVSSILNALGVRHRTEAALLWRSR
jgi:DNA-binding NarL/FixJ family response regulator